MDHLHSYLLAMGLPVDLPPAYSKAIIVLVTTALAAMVYFILSCRRSPQSRERLLSELEKAKLKVRRLEEKLMMATAEGSAGRKREVRIFLDGAFDMMHYGHMNAFRLGRSLGTHLVVGLNSEEDITKCKGKPLLNDRERLTMIKGCKFVDEVVENVPYIMSKEYLDHVFERYNIDYVVHGDDPCLVDGKDVYAAAKESGRFLSIPRTEGVSTTDILGRMLLMTKDHHQQGTSGHLASSDNAFPTLLGQKSKFLTTSFMMRAFSAGVRAPTKDMKVIYMDGAWDMFHCGHVEILEAAKQRGDYLIVGIHGDVIVNKLLGSNLPLMNLHERVLSVMGCRYVDDVLIDAPYEITREMVASLNISEVLHGSRSDEVGRRTITDKLRRYEYPKETGILSIIESPSDFNLASVIERVQDNHKELEKKFERKKNAESNYYLDKYGNGRT